MEFLLTGAIFVYMYVSAVACSRIAAGKGRGADEWFVCGQLLGVVAVITVLLLPPLKEAPRQLGGSRGA